MINNLRQKETHLPSQFAFHS